MFDERFIDEMERATRKLARKYHIPIDCTETAAQQQNLPDVLLSSLNVLFGVGGTSLELLSDLGNIAFAAIVQELISRVMAQIYSFICAALILALQ